MNNIRQEQEFSLSKEEPILGYLFKKLLRQEPKMKGRDVNEELNRIEEFSEAILNQNDPRFTERFENISKHFSEEELKEVFINFFEDLTDQPLSEREKLVKINNFFANFGFQISHNSDGNAMINCI